MNRHTHLFVLLFFLLWLTSCTFNARQGDDGKPRFEVGSSLTIQDFKTIKRILGGVALPIPTTPWSFFQF